MSISIGFSQANQILQRPPSLSAQECTSLEVYRGEAVTISKWQFSDEELQALCENGGKCFLVILGTMHPPVAVTPLDPFRK